MIVSSYDASNLILWNEKDNNVVIGGNERYIGNDNVAVMVCVHKYKIFDILIQIEFDFFHHVVQNSVGVCILHCCLAGIRLLRVVKTQVSICERSFPVETCQLFV